MGPLFVHLKPSGEVASPMTNLGGADWGQCGLGALGPGRSTRVLKLAV